MFLPTLIIFILCYNLHFVAAQHTSQLHVIQSSDERIRYSGNWSAEDGSMVSSEKGASASLSFNGTICVLRVMHYAVH